MSLHIGWAGFLTTACYIIIYMMIVRTLSSRYPDSPVSKAFGFLS